jgi:hypothetical protein
MGGMFCFFYGSREMLTDEDHSWMTFCPEWLVGSPNLNTSNPLYLWVYLAVSHVSVDIASGADIPLRPFCS